MKDFAHEQTGHLPIAMIMMGGGDARIKGRANDFITIKRILPQWANVIIYPNLCSLHVLHVMTIFKIKFSSVDSPSKKVLQHNDHGSMRLTALLTLSIVSRGRAERSCVALPASIPSLIRAPVHPWPTDRVRSARCWQCHALTVLQCRSDPSWLWRSGSLAHSHTNGMKPVTYE